LDIAKNVFQVHGIDLKLRSDLASVIFPIKLSITSIPWLLATRTSACLAMPWSGEPAQPAPAAKKYGPAAALDRAKGRRYTNPSSLGITFGYPGAVRDAKRT